MKIFAIGLSALGIFSFMAQAAPQSIDLSGVYSRPKCQGKGGALGLFRGIYTSWSGENFKLTIKQSSGGATQDGVDFEIISVESQVEEDIRDSFDNSWMHRKSKPADIEIYDSRPGHPLVKFFTLTPDSIVYDERVFLDDSGDGFGSSHSKTRFHEIYQMIDGNLVVRGRIESRGYDLLLGFFPLIRGKSVDEYQCVFERNTLDRR